MYSRAFMSGIQYIMNNNKKKAKSSKKGAYVATATAQKSNAPRMVNTGRNSRRIIHRELVSSVNGSVAFTANRFAINPGMASTFPWLASQADGWEQYRFNKLCFEFVTRCATSTVGSVILAPDYDPQDSDPVSESQVTSYQDAIENAPWRDQVCHLSPQAMFPMGPRKFIRTSLVAGDARTYDAGNFYLCTVEEVGANAIGKLWVSYDVELFVPQIAPSAPIAGISSVLHHIAGAQALATATPEAVLFDTFVSNGLRLGAAATGVFTPPAGAYNVMCSVIGKDTSTEAFTLELELYKNGAPLADKQISTIYSPSHTANGQHPIVLFGYLSCNGTDTFELEVTATGAAGTLTLMDQSSTLLISLA